MSRLSLLAATLLALLAGCGGDSEVLELRAFLSAEAPATLDSDKLDQLNQILARQAVRAWGYESSGGRPSSDDGFAPLVDAGGKAVDVAPWIRDEVIGRDGRVSPKAEQDSSQDPAALPLETRQLFRVKARMAAAEAALRSLGVTRISWAAIGDQAIEIDGGGARVNPRLLHLLRAEPGGAPAAAHDGLGLSALPVKAPSAEGSEGAPASSARPPTIEFNAITSDCDTCSCSPCKGCLNFHIGL